MATSLHSRLVELDRDQAALRAIEASFGSDWPVYDDPEHHFSQEQMGLLDVHSKLIDFGQCMRTTIDDAENLATILSACKKASEIFPDHKSAAKLYTQM